MKRKRKILVIQVAIFVVASSLLFMTYSPQDVSDKKEINKLTEKKVTSEKVPDSNTFENVEYKGVDINGNRYVINSGFAEFDLDLPELIKMRVMYATFYFKDGSLLTVSGDWGTYNNKTFDMEFRDNIKAVYQDNNLYSDNLDYYSSKNLLTIYGNVFTESIQGTTESDKLVFDLKKQTLDMSMYDNKQVNVKLKKQ